MTPSRRSWTTVACHRENADLDPQARQPHACAGSNVQFNMVRNAAGPLG